MRIERLGALGDAPAVLHGVAAAARTAGLPPPAALIGDWFSSRAVIAPSVSVTPVAPDAAFDVAQNASGPAGSVGGGWFGYLCYPDPGAEGAARRIPEAAGGWSDCVLRQDADGVWWFESISGAALPTWLDAPKPATSASRRSYTITWVAPDRDDHRRGVLACLEAIAAGEVYQACVCTRFTGRIDGEPIDFFTDTVARTAPSRAAYVAGDWGAVASLSPELFLRRAGAAVASSPIKGTLPRSADPAGLLASVKDVAENIMIVDLVRNDLGRVATTGSVTVPELLAVRPAPGVWHLVSTVTAEVPAHLPMSALLESTFPPASVTGTPKRRARQLLQQWEPARRGVYCGTVGLASPVAGCELNVAIRTVEFGADGSAVLGVGGGITADSDPDLEWEECLHKAASIVSPGRAARRRRARAETALPG
ncbi:MULTISPECIES: aminodeoxychorismate synthase component I [unclassified Mycolicibacterium]|uniref:aminodeoxychorismate synthase component I n=1 Tax=unclassified Mycolicibacterium TaxID=2636767 RepID=UPI0012DF705B|nr:MULTISPECIES: aminodeoxychorismate synthase component I [unclassified Mycolicibacterium]MUL85294.1 aminodeoxychorismate synthase component I [Mycolicibacterium sp. CBMA 329]MUL91261.1 aminodeoxychorismate synthase component I [Mycolicibacterium sp. CBMA 331]MUM02539.1 aminodeoxychorismate synthase component I [Mycolicibacterium sp. CBMA 334]MUM41020.1 aminodeoxychorismate synthase component I [Mycolicibacterium sp. CBMA 247]MUM47216.1 aminodeoxychorismate synthase component I [Mycolicibacte